MAPVLSLHNSPLARPAAACAWKGWSAEVQRVAAFDYAPSRIPRYYQLNAINRTVEAIAAGQTRVLLVMATGTGKTYTAFQIIHRLWKSPWREGQAKGQKRILFLADRNILIDQTMVNDFRPFKGAMAKLSPNAKGIERVDAQGRLTVEDVDLAVHKNSKEINKSYEIYLSLYQAVTPTKVVWYYEHPYPAGVKNYNKTKPIRIEEFDAEKAWWGTEADGFAARVENERAWRVSIDAIRAANYNLDQKNPHAADLVSHDPAQLLADYARLQGEAQGLRDQLRDILAKSMGGQSMPLSGTIKP